MPAAGFWARAGALVLDTVFLFALQFVAKGGFTSGFLAVFLYATLTVGLWGRSLGQWAAGIKVVRASDGGPLGFPAAAIRALVSPFSGIFFGLGYAMIPLNARKRALHDFAAGCVVVYPQPVSFARRAAASLLGTAIVILPVTTGFWFMGGGRAVFDVLAARGSARTGADKDGATKGRLGRLRSAAAVSFAGHDHAYPENPDDLYAVKDAGGKRFIEKAEPAETSTHPAILGFTVYGGEACAAGPSGPTLDAAALKDTGGWGYVKDKTSACDGLIFVDCTHADAMGRPWFGF